MPDTAYTLAQWRVRPGQEDAFVSAWGTLAESFSSLPAAPLWGTLLRSETDPQLFYSFGPWRSADDIAVMRANPQAQEALVSVMALCETATPGAFTLVKHVDVQRAK